MNNEHLVSVFVILVLVAGILRMNQFTNQVANSANKTVYTG